jgi:cephalosporin hydroxylase
VNLWGEFLEHSGRKVHKWTHYFPAYERHLARFAGLSVTMLEIGLGHGGSVRMWKRYLGPYAQIVGIDIKPKFARYGEHHVAIRIGSQSDPDFLLSLVEEFGPFDIVLDDGSHRMDDMLTSLRTLYPTLTRNGVYMVEDTHTCYWPRAGGGLGAPASFIEVSKGLVDELHAYHAEELEPTEFTRSTTSMHFYDGIVVFERGRHEPGIHIHTGQIAKGDDA